MKDINPQFDDTNLDKSNNPLSDPQAIQSHVNGLQEQDDTSTQESVNPFPLEIFPKTFQEIVIATNECLNFPIDFIGASMLYASSIAIGNSYCLEVKKGWVSSAVLYMAIVGRPGVNKSHPLSFALQPLIDSDSRSFRQYESDKAEYENVLRMDKKERDLNGHGEPTKPILKKLIVVDSTPEALVSLHNSNYRGMGLCMDELVGWLKNFNRYNSGSEEQFWLSNWSGKPIDITRKTSDPLRIVKPFIGVCGTIQTSILNELAKGDRGKNGFVERVLMVIPEGLQVNGWNDKDLPESISGNWKCIIENLLNNPCDLDSYSTVQPRVLRFSQDAWKNIRDWQQRNTNLCNSSSNDGLSSIYIKLEQYCIRFCLILQLLESACNGSQPQEISLDVTNGAIELTEYFRSHSRKAYDIVFNPDPLEDLPANKQKLYECLPEITDTKTAIQEGKRLGISERTIKRFLKEHKYFQKIGHGEYEKKL